mgnify:FL=1
MIAPTLLVGLGGTGSKIVCRVSQMVTEEQRKRIGFAVFDTDINELREIREANPFIKTIQTSTKLTVGEYLNIDTHARDEWFPVNGILNSKSLTEGAGQYVRFPDWHWTQRSVREIWSLCIMQSRNFTSWRAIPQNRH